MGARGYSHHPLFALFLGIGSIATTILLFRTTAPLAAVLGFDIAALGFLLACAARLGRASPSELRRSAARNDGGRLLLLFTSASIASAMLIVVGIEMREPIGAFPGELAVIGATLLFAWAFANTVFAIHYAHVYYDDEKGSDRKGLEFPGDADPDFWDFIYFAFVLGMTFQVSDVAICRSDLRRIATFHAIVAFLFNIGIVALTVNLVAGTTGASLR